MRELPATIPDVDVLLALEPEELAAKMLFLLRARQEDMFSAGNLENELWSISGSGGLTIHESDRLRSAWQFVRLVHG